MFGYDRSGTTLLSLMVGAHPDIAVPFSTTDLWYRLNGKLDDYNQLASNDDVQQLVDDILQDERIKLWDVDLDREQLLADLPTGDYAAVVDRIHSAYAREKGKSRWGNISIATIRYMHRVNEWFPDAQFIHIVRDGRDVAVSHMNYEFGTDNVYDCVTKWVNAVGQNLRMGEMLGADRYMVIKYEDLILDTENALRRMCDFLSVPYSAAMMDHLAAGEGKIPESKKFLWPIISKPLDPSRVGRWKTRLSMTKRTIFEAHGTYLLRELAYEEIGKTKWSVRSFLADLFYYLGRDGRHRRIRERFSRKRKHQDKH